MSKAVRDAWDLYRIQTRRLTGAEYYAVEPWAWAQLQRRLSTIRSAQRRKVAV